MPPFFKRFEDNANGGNDFHAEGEPLRAADQRSGIGLPDMRVDATGRLQERAHDDFNGSTQFGAGTYQLTRRDGVREPAATAFLHRAGNQHGMAVTGRAELAHLAHNQHLARELAADGVTDHSAGRGGDTERRGDAPGDPPARLPPSVGPDSGRPTARVGGRRRDRRGGGLLSAQAGNTASARRDDAGLVRIENGSSTS